MKAEDELSEGGGAFSRALAVGAATLGATALRLYLLGKRSLWLDEGSSVAIARSDWPKLAKLVWLGEANMALYYVLLHMWLRVGSSEFVLRSLSVVFAVATIPAIYLLGKELFGPRVGLVAAFLLAVNAGHIEYSQDARAYALVVFLVVLSMLCLMRSLRNPTLGNWASYAVITALSGYAHLFAILTVPAYAVGLVFFRPNRRIWKKFAYATGAVMALWLPLGMFVMTRDIGQLAWVPPTSFRSVRSVFYLLTGDLYWHSPLAVLNAAALLLALAGLAIALRSRSRKAGPYGLVWAALLVPFMATLAISHFRPALVDRYLLICMPPFVLLIASGISEIPMRWAARVAVIGLAILALRSDYDYYRYFHLEDWRGATNYVVSHAEWGDAVVIYADEARWPFDYYFQRMSHGHQRVPVVFPDWNSYFCLGKVYAGGCDSIGPSRSSLAEIRAHYRRVWVILSHDQVWTLHRQSESRLIRTSLGREYLGLSEHDFSGVRVLLYSGAQLVAHATVRHLPRVSVEKPARLRLPRHA